MFYHFNDVFDFFTVTISRAEIYDKFKETDFIPLDFTLVSQFTRARQEHFLMSHCEYNFFLQQLQKWKNFF